MTEREITGFVAASVDIAGTVISSVAIAGKIPGQTGIDGYVRTSINIDGEAPTFNPVSTVPALSFPAASMTVYTAPPGPGGYISYGGGVYIVTAKTGQQGGGATYGGHPENNVIQVTGTAPSRHIVFYERIYDNNFQYIYTMDEVVV